MGWQFNGNEAVFIQIANRLRRDIANGIYQPDTQIPPVRQLASEASVNPNTMQRALSLLEEEGLLCARGTSGRFVTADASVINDTKEAIRKEAVRRLLTETKALGITLPELIDYIKEEQI